MNNQTDLTDFHCIRCHACCRQAGYVRLKPGEAEKIAAYLGMDILEFTSRFTILTKDRQALSLIEKENGACLFLDENGCKINDVKPQQCRDFPHKWRFSDFETICGWAKKIGNRKQQTAETIRRNPYLVEKVSPAATGTSTAAVTWAKAAVSSRQISPW